MFPLLFRGETFNKIPPFGVTHELPEANLRSLREEQCPSDNIQR